MKPIFICGIGEGFLKLLKCRRSGKSKMEILDLAAEVLPLDIDEKKLNRSLKLNFQKLGFGHHPLIISLARSKVITRYLKVPAQAPGEIEKIVSLQASRYLPFSADELISGYQILSVDQQGYSEVNLIILHQDVVKPYLEVLKELRPPRPKIILNSCGLVNLFTYLKPLEVSEMMLLEIDSDQVEVAVAYAGKLLFSRYFKVNQSLTHWEDSLINEINKTKDAYLKELGRLPPQKIFLAGAQKSCREFAQVLNKQDFLVEVLSYEKLNLSASLLEKILTSQHSFASMIGLGLKDSNESLNLLPQSLKEEAKLRLQFKERLRLILSFGVIILLFGLGVARNLENKARYLQGLKRELHKISQEAAMLEELEKRIKIRESLAQKKILSLDILSWVHQAIPQSVSLINLVYEEDQQVVLQGQAPELNSVLVFVSELEKAEVFKNFNLKVRYATKRKREAGEIVDFEIICLKK